jgi:hypothetical protein
MESFLGEMDGLCENFLHSDYRTLWQSYGALTHEFSESNHDQMFFYNCSEFHKI